MDQTLDAHAIGWPREWEHWRTVPTLERCIMELYAHHWGARSSYDGSYT